MPRKVNVTRTPGAGAIGQMDAKVGMRTNEGVIQLVDVNPVSSGDIATFVASGGYPTPTFTTDAGYLPSSGLYKEYIDKLEVTEAEASGAWSWPTGDGSIQFGHAAQPSAVYAPTPGSGQIVYLVGGVPVTAYR